MSNTNLLLPIFDPKKFVQKDGEIITPLYRVGDPRNYRLDMSKGVLTLEGREQVTKPGQSFRVLPIAFRCLKDGLFGQEEKRWCEVYFINEAGHLSMFMFHGYSVQNLSEATRDLFYQEKSLTQVIWNIRLEQKMNKEGAKYYIASFDFDMVPLDDFPVLEAIKNNILDSYYHIYRSDTADAKTLFQDNWSDGKIPTSKELEDEEKRLKGLMRLFATPEEKEAMAITDNKKEKATKAA